jgi:CheY-like chemotaxis protein
MTGPGWRDAMTADDHVTLEPAAATHSAGVDRAAPRITAGPVMAKILVADDDPRNLYAVEQMLRAPGIELVLVESGEEVLRRILHDDFALILLDVRMPRIDGYEVAAMIRGRPRSSRIPILFLTAYNKDELHVFRGYSAGAVDYVFKPIEPLILKSKVDVFVDLYRKTEEIRRQGEEERRLLSRTCACAARSSRPSRPLRRRERASVARAAVSADRALHGLVQEDHRAQFNERGIRDHGFPRGFRTSRDFWQPTAPDDQIRVWPSSARCRDGAVTPSIAGAARRTDVTSSTRRADPRRRRKPARDLRHVVRHLRAQADGRACSTPRSSRRSAPDRRHRTRLQQHAERGDRQSRPSAELDRGQ